MSEPQAEAAESGAAGQASQAARGGRRSGRRASRGQVALQRGRTPAGTVTMQARVDAGFARELEADLLVIGATGHSALYERMIGSRADRIIQLAPCPVLVVK